MLGQWPDHVRAQRQFDYLANNNVAGKLIWLAFRDMHEGLPPLGFLIDGVAANCHSQSKRWFGWPICP
jgi:hypothetical protein